MALLEILNLTKGFRSPDGSVTPILDVPSFSLDAGAQVALAGSSGSGKTTLLHLIAGILTPDSGSVEVDGTSVHTLSESKRDAFRARNIGYVFQTFNLLGGFTALENVLLGMTFGPGADREFAKSLLERLDLADRLDHRPGQLSIGQQQRVALARALANRPRLVLADEPTGNLDRKRSSEALDMIREMCAEQDAALLLVTHDSDALAKFDTTMDLTDVNRASTAFVDRSVN